MVFGIAGGIGAGVFAFHYEKEDFSSFFIAGRHLWQDDRAYFVRAAPRFGAAATVTESGGAKKGLEQLREALANGPVIAWVDMTHLPHRGMPESWSGGGYHVIVIYEIDESAKVALAGDLTDDPIPIPLDDLARARARIRSQKHRLLALERREPVDLRAAVIAGLRACRDGLAAGGKRNFTLAAFEDWALRLSGSSARDSWDRVFRHGRPLWVGLRSVCDFIEFYGTGGGLMRPLFAEFLAEAGAALGERRLTALAARYSAIGTGWSELAAAALPAGVPELAETYMLLTRKTELLHAGGGSTGPDIRAVWALIEEMGVRIDREFSLALRDAAGLRADLRGRVLRLHDEETSALAGLGEVMTSMS
jgi:hypothetical protein